MSPSILCGCVFLLLSILTCAAPGEKLTGTWVKSFTPPSPRIFSSFFNIANNLYLLGGKELSMDGTQKFKRDLWQYNVTSNKWSLLRPEFRAFPDKVRACVWAFDNGDVYHWGGFDTYGLSNTLYWTNVFTQSVWLSRTDLKNAPSPRMDAIHWIHNASHLAVVGGQSAQGLLTDLNFLEINTGLWTMLQTVGLSFPGIQILKGMMVGGYVKEMNAVFGYVTLWQQVWKLDISNRTWSPVTPAGDPPLEPLDHTLSIIVNAQLFLIGGSSPQGRARSYVTLDLATLKWTRKSQLPEARSLASVTAISATGNVYIFGGTVRGLGLSNDLLMLDNQGDVYRLLGPSDQPDPRYDHSTTTVGDSLYVFGGFGSTSMNDLWIVNPDFTWTPVLTTNAGPGPRFGHIAWYSMKEYYYVCAGATDANSYLSDFWRFSLTTYNWEFVSASTSLRQRMYATPTTFGGVTYVYGGRLPRSMSSDLWYFNSAGVWSRFSICAGCARPGRMERVSLSANETHIFLFGGVMESGLLNEDVWTFQIEGAIFRNIGSLFKGVKDPNRNMIVVTPFSTTPIIQVFVAVLLLNSSSVTLTLWTEAGSIEPTVMGQPTDALGTMQMINDNLVFIGGSSSSSKANENLDRIHLNCSEPNCITCGLGLYATPKGDCLFCPAGTYDESRDASSCTPCPQGTFGVYAGATTSRLCIPCPQGSFANATGQTECFDCSNGDQNGRLQCDEGVAYPHKAIQEHKTISTSFKINMNKKGIEYITDIIGLMSLVVVGVACLLFSAFVWCGPKLAPWMKRFDVLCWDNHVNLCNENFVLNLQTSLGGIMSIKLFLLIILLVGCAFVRPLFHPTEISQKMVIKDTHIPHSAPIDVRITLANAVTNGPDCKCVDKGSTMSLREPLKCSRENSTMCVAAFQGMVNTSSSATARLIIATNAVAGRISLALTTQTSSAMKDYMQVTTSCRTEHPDAKMVGSILYKSNVLFTTWDTEAGDGSGWNVRVPNVEVGREEIVVSGSTNAVSGLVIELSFTQLKTEIYIVENTGVSGFTASIVLCIISGVITFGRALHRVLEHYTYRRSPTKTPWIRQFEDAMALRHQQAQEALQSFAENDEGEDPKDLIKMTASNEVYIPSPPSLHRSDNTFELEDCETLRQLSYSPDAKKSA